jgi:cytochrome c553
MLSALGMLLWLTVQAPAGTAPAAAPDLLSQSAAVTPDPGHGMVLYRKHCMECHGPHAWGDGPREIPALAGQQERYLLEQLVNFLTGVRAGSAMHGPVMQEALGPTDVDRPQSLSDLADYLAHAAPNPHAETGEGRALALGKSAYNSGCSGCHGENGGGNATLRAPLLAGQHARYLLSRVREFSSIHPGLPAPPAEQQAAIADYVSRLEAGATAGR